MIREWRYGLEPLTVRDAGATNLAEALTNIAGPWINTTNTTSGYTLEPTETTQFFRVQNKFDALRALAQSAGIQMP